MLVVFYYTQLWVRITPSPCGPLLFYIHYRFCLTIQYMFLYFIISFAYSFVYSRASLIRTNWDSGMFGLVNFPIHRLV
jgi:hypothetical protein